jgi:hypothetical protein
MPDREKEQVVQVVRGADAVEHRAAGTIALVRHSSLPTDPQLWAEPKRCHRKGAAATDNSGSAVAPYVRSIAP